MALWLCLMLGMANRDPVVFYHGRDAFPLRTLDQAGMPFVALQDFTQALGLPASGVGTPEWTVTVYNRPVVFQIELGMAKMAWKSEPCQFKQEDGVVYLRVDQLVQIFGELLGKNLIYESTTHTIHLPKQETLKLRLVFEDKGEGPNLFFYFSDHIEQPTVHREKDRLIVHIAKPFVTVDQSQLGENPVIAATDLFQKLPDGGSEFHIILKPEVENFQLEPFTTFNTSLRIRFQGNFAPANPLEETADLESDQYRIRKIVLDPGHGGNDEGARGPTGLKEKIVTMDISRKLKRYLELDGNYEVTLTRNDDFHLPLKVRTGLANNIKADLFVSIHVNAIVRPDAWGGETYYLSLDESGQSDFTVDFENQEHESDEASPLDVEGADPGLELLLWDLAQNEFRDDSFRLARYVQQELNDLAGVRNRGVKQAPLKVLKGATMPAILVEVAFISNPQEERNLKETVFKERIAQAIGRAIMLYDQDVQRRYAQLRER